MEARGTRGDRVWELAPALASLTTMLVKCAEEAQEAGDHAASRAYVAEASETGKKNLKLLERAQRPAPDDVAVSHACGLCPVSGASAASMTSLCHNTQDGLIAGLLRNASKLVKLHAPAIGTLFARTALDLAPKRLAADCGVQLSQALVASRRLNEALATAVKVCVTRCGTSWLVDGEAGGLSLSAEQASEVAKKASAERANALVRAAQASIELGDFAQAATFAREGWDTGRKLWRVVMMRQSMGCMLTGTEMKQKEDLGELGASDVQRNGWPLLTLSVPGRQQTTW
jgi:hypothetical protein